MYSLPKFCCSDSTAHLSRYSSSYLPTRDSSRVIFHEDRILLEDLVDSLIIWSPRTMYIDNIQYLYLQNLIVLYSVYTFCICYMNIEQ